jgi:hypothetical protein
MRFLPLLTIALFASACMSTSDAPKPAGDPAATPQLSMAEVQDALAQAPHTSTGVRCSDLDWQDVFWAEPEMIHPVGYLTCSCFQLEDLTGVESPYISLAYEFACDDGGCSSGVCQ